MSGTAECAAQSAGESPVPYYVDERTLHRLIAPHLGWERFKAQVKADERRGFPRIRADWGGRCWPKVKAWLDNDNGVANHVTQVDAEDGPETFDAPPQRSSRVQARAAPAAVLDRAPGGARSDRIPRLVHRAPARGG